MVIALSLLMVIASLASLMAFVLKREADKARATTTRLMADHQPDEMHIGLGGAFIAFRGDETVIYGTPAWTEVVKFEALRAVEVRRDGVTLTKTNRGSQLAGAAIGGLAFGGVGAIIGGLSGSTTSSEKIKSVGLAFVFANPKHPFHEVTFGSWPGGGVGQNDLIASRTFSDLDRIRARALWSAGSV